MKAPTVTRSRFSLSVDIGMCALMVWGVIDGILHREWISAVLFALVGVSAIFTLISRRRERMRQDSSTT